jgi:hypothetical protein
MQEIADRFAGGEVRYTEAVPGDRFTSREEANAYCARSFGPEWRVLSFHEVGGFRIVSFSNIPANTRMWIDVKDQPFGNCWSRQKSEE